MRWFESSALWMMPIFAGAGVVAIAFWVSLYAPQDSRRESWGFAFGLLMLIMIGTSIWNERVSKRELKSANEEANKRIAELQTSLRELLEKNPGALGPTPAVANPAHSTVAARSQHTPLVVIEPAPETQQGLPKRARELSQEIKAFVVQRQLQEPAIPSQANWEADIADTTRFGASTMQLFNDRFGERLFGIRNEFKKEGIVDPLFETLYRHPANIQSMQMIAGYLDSFADMHEKRPVSTN
jgi:hypothetical protein